MEIFIIALLIIISIIFFLLEIFIIPGISIAGIISGISALYAFYYSFSHLGTTAGIVTIIVTSVGFIISIIAFMRSKTLDKISLNKNITSKVDKNSNAHIAVGDKGLTTTRLALIGMAQIGGSLVEVKSEDGFLNEKTPIIVTRIEDKVIFVQKIND